jgi:hypothetical protein
VDATFHRVGRRLGFRFATGSASSFSMRTGLAAPTTLPLFTLRRYWSCYSSLECFHAKVRPFALKGNCFQPFSTLWKFNLPLNGAQAHVVLLFERSQSQHRPKDRRRFDADKHSSMNSFRDCDPIRRHDIQFQ